MFSTSNMADSDIDIIDEIIDFVEPQKGYSYYDLERYAYENNKEDWLALLRNRRSRRTIALYLRSKRRTDGVPYKNFFGYTPEEIKEMENRSKKKKD